MRPQTAPTQQLRCLWGKEKKKRRVNMFKVLITQYSAGGKEILLQNNGHKYTETHSNAVCTKQKTMVYRLKWTIMPKLQLQWLHLVKKRNTIKILATIMLFFQETLSPSTACHSSHDDSHLFKLVLVVFLFHFYYRCRFSRRAPNVAGHRL